MLSEFLREIRDVTQVQKRHEEELRAAREEDNMEPLRRAEGDRDNLPDITMNHSEKATFIPVPEHPDSPFEDQDTPMEEKDLAYEERDIGSKPVINHQQDLVLMRDSDWEPGQGVKIDYAAIVEILIDQLDDQPERSSSLMRRPFICINADVQTMRYSNPLRFVGCQSSSRWPKK